MRVMPLITAIAVMAILYGLVFERDRVLEFARGPGDAAETPATPVEPEGPDETPEAGPAVVSVVAIHSTASDVTNGVLVRGRTEAARQVAVRAETSGQVISEPLRKGTTVSADQMLCQLDPGTRQATLAEAEARLAEAKARVPEAQSRLPEANARKAEAEARLGEAEINLRAAERLSEDGFASETRVASAQAAYESALAAVEAAKSAVANSNSGLESASAGIRAAQAAVAAATREIEKLTVTAPFAGLLETDTAEIGSFLQPGALCATVIQLNPIKLVGFVPETEVSRIATGALAGGRLATGQDITGKVTFISRSADPVTRTFRVEILVDNTGGTIRDGQTADIAIASDGLPAHLLPLSSLTLNDDGDLGVRSVGEGDIVEFLPVTVVRDTVDGVWVSGLPDTVDVIVVGQEYVVHGVAVDVTFKGDAT